MTAFSAIKSTVEQIATDIKSLRANTHAKGQDLNINNKALIFSDAGGTTNNIDHVWHDETNNAMHLCSDTTLRALGNSTVCSGSSAFLGNVIELNHIAERFDRTSHGRL